MHGDDVRARARPASLRLIVSVAIFERGRLTPPALVPRGTNSLSSVAAMAVDAGLTPFIVRNVQRERRASPPTGPKVMLISYQSDR